MTKRKNPLINYPATRVCDQVDDYHGTKVADPYRWLEDPNAAETKNWVTAQNALTDSILAGIPERELIKDRLTKLWNYEKFGTPFKQGDRTFYYYNS
ncbi:MAG TPA: S9 family peptidase, partial [Candidatus Melainabacteria bacterium]|nr:S9 family peptidase [Candidatus Melainabacteria bacterium]